MNPRSIRSEKVVLIGSQGCGKTSIVLRYCKNVFSGTVGSTVGAAFNSKVVNYAGHQIQLDIWDTAGSEKYRSLAPMYYRDARVAIIVVDITNKDSLSEADDWVKAVREGGRSDCAFVLAANKCDLEDKRQIKNEEINEFAFSHQIPYYRNTSSLTGEGITELFEAISDTLSKMTPLQSANSEIDNLLVGTNSNPPPSSGCNC
ncbi:small GTP-binding protein, putative [Trichomonas vaginalis G3]|uniref:Small GTP-binding protein, putative n=2 Tax=Trichomonas vaginalis TaxID=5722 RepID=A0A8U0WP08_TRIV3|nr:small Rab GTPase Rab5d [Trichomonas vaginalis G3]AAY83818.1 small Rab GTPase Rab5d [Trichomonas vaginalis]EAY04312.1 small GTP-binding protein, putative [Trichomonas vaginalis G3]KAI5498275.1 small Rab GTPase Rab5d [Trichomonas vaginalis G3]|eukprot:XP_001316535.1 small GTP-binding protein [Trichomonas vaginalis G3]